MPDQFTETSSRSWGSNILNSFIGALIGIVLFVASFAVLWMNEGRANLAKIAGQSVAASPQAEGKLAYVSDKLNATAPVGDGEYLKPGPYITLERKVEMYAWVEEKNDTTHDKLGGGTEVTTTYNYKKEWVHAVADASQFKYPDGHGNPQLTVQPQTVYASPATVGTYSIDAKDMELPTPTAVTINADAAITNNAVRLDGNYLYAGKGSVATPDVGDVRVSFLAVRSGTAVTAFGKLEATSLTPYFQGKTKLYRALDGNRDEALATLATEYKTVGWLMRLLGFLMMWIGLALFFGPINALLKVVPLMGSIGKGLVGFAMFFVALVLSAVTIVVALIAHSIIALIIALVVVTGLIVFFVRKRKK